MWVKIDCCFVLVVVVAVTVFAVDVVVVVTLFPHSHRVGSCRFFCIGLFRFLAKSWICPWHRHNDTPHSTFAHPHTHTHEGFTVNGGALEKHFSSTWISCQTFPLFFLSIFCVNIFETFWQSLLYLLSFHTLPAALNWAMFCFALLRTFFFSLSFFLAHFVMMLFLSFLRRRGSCRTFSGNTWLKWWQLIGLGFHLLSLLTAQLLRHTGVLWLRGSVFCVCVYVFPPPFLIVSITLQRCFFCLGKF